jgi:diamine N-acetyltransferase
MTDAGAAGAVSLREITGETVRAIVKLAVAPAQQGFVASNAISLAQALFSPEAWYRAIYVGDTPAGFVMLHDESLRPVPPGAPQIGLWRFMIDARFQRQGIGVQALDLVIEHVRRKRLFASLSVSYVPGPGCAEPFYLRAGFRHTGRLDEGEVVLELALDGAKFECDRLMAAFFRAVSFEPGATPDYAQIHALFIEDGLLIKNSGKTPEVSGLQQFIEPRQALAASGALTRFHESELGETTQVFGNVAQRFSRYTKSGTQDGTNFDARGTISTQFVRTPAGWRISAMAWDDERPGLALPPA